MFDNSDSVGFLELANGCFITETIVAPHGKGHAGLNFYQSLEELESRLQKIKK
jgi:hypothetical protein